MAFSILLLLAAAVSFSRLVFFAILDLLVPSQVHSVRPWHIIRDMLAGIDEVESRHFAHDHENIIDIHPGGLHNRLRQLHRELVLLLFRSSIADITANDGHWADPLF